MNALFSYRARNVRGALESGVLYAQSKDEALRNLRQRDLTPLELKQPRSDQRKLLSDKTARDLTRNLAHLLGSGLTLAQALQFAAQELDPVGAALALSIKEAAEQGRPLAEGLQAFRGPAAELLVGVLRAGSESGQLARALAYAATTFARSAEATSRLRTGMIYPVFVLVASLGTLGGFLWFVVPTLASALENSPNLPWSTRALLGLSNWFRSNGDLVAAGLGVSALSLLTPPVRRAGARLLETILATPLAMGIPIRLELANWSSLTALSLETGATAVTAFEAAVAGVRSRRLADQLLKAVELMRVGERPASALSRCVQAPQIMLRLLQVGEETGRAPEAMTQASEALAREAEQRLSRLGALAGPAVTVLLGGLVAAMVVSLYLGLLSISDQVAL